MKRSNRSRNSANGVRARLTESQDDSDAGEPEAGPTKPRSRRDFLKYGSAAAVGLVAGTMLDGDGASAEDNKLKLGERNEAFSPTVLHADTLGKAATFQAENNSINEGVAIQALKPNGGFAIVGASSGEDSVGVYGGLVDGGQGTGVVGNIPTGSQGTGVSGVGRSGGEQIGVGVNGGAIGPNGIGVLGTGDSLGVEGESPEGIGVQGTSFSGHGVIGSIPDEGDGDGVYGYTGYGRGVVGESKTNDGVRGETSAGPEFPEGLRAGVHGIGENAIGVLGEGAINGVQGQSDSGDGVFGFSRASHGVSGAGTGEGAVGVRGIAGAGPGVLAESRSAKTGDLLHGLALMVNGAAQFSNAGTGTVLGDSSGEIHLTERFPPSAFVLVTLTSDPGPGRSVWVDKYPDDDGPGTGYFIVHLTPVEDPPPSTNFAYLVLEHP